MTRRCFGGAWWPAIALGVLACGGDHEKAASRPDMQVMGDSYKHRRGDPLPADSALFDGREVTLRGVRGETLGVQVLFAGDEPGRHRVDVRESTPGVTVQPFEMDWIEVTRASTAMYGLSRGTGWYPDRLVPADAPIDTEAGAFFDIAISADAAPGTYGAELRVDGRVIPVTLTIEPTRIDVGAEPLLWVWYHPGDLAEAHGLEPDSAAALELEREYSALFRAHGAFISTMYASPEALRPREDLMAGVRWWPVQIDRSDDEQRFKHSVRTWIDYFRDRPEVAFAVGIDEPHTDEVRLRVKKWGAWARQVGAGKGRFLYAVTDGPRDIYGDVIDVYISWKGIPRLDPTLDAYLWTYNGAYGYAGSMIIDTHGTALRTWGWIAYRYGVPLWYAWSGMYYRDKYNHRGYIDVLENPITFMDRDDAGNGDGMLAYPSALPSLRLKALRRGLQDRLLLRALAGCGARARAKAIAARMIPKAMNQTRHGAEPYWRTEEPPWERARQDILDALRAACREPQDLRRPRTQAR